MKVKDHDYDVGVIVGRFQVPELHPGHIKLIQVVCDRHDKVIIFLGLSPLMVTKENPLDFESRKQLILEKFPKVLVLYAKDQYSDEVWSSRLDEQIKDVTTPSQTVVLYGSRDSFISHYTGRHATLELESDQYFSGSEVRKQISRAVKATPDFRRGVVWAAFSKFPTCYTTVDIAIVNGDGTKILLGRKPNEDKYRLIGGFADPKSETFEADARREVYEEASITVEEIRYVCSMKIDDWRYRGEEDCIKTMLFTAIHTQGTPKAADDIAEVRWFEIEKLGLAEIVETHRPLIVKVLPVLREAKRHESK